MIWVLALYSLVFWGSLRFFTSWCLVLILGFFHGFVSSPCFVPHSPPLCVSVMSLSSVCLTRFHFLCVSSLVSPVCHLLPCLLVPFPSLRVLFWVSMCVLLPVLFWGFPVSLIQLCHVVVSLAVRAPCVLVFSSVHCCFQVTMFLDFCSVRVSALVQRFKNGINCLGIRPICIQ